MKKYSFLIYHREYDSFLDDLQKLGAVHIVETADEIAEDIRDRMQYIKRIDQAIKVLRSRSKERTVSSGIEPEKVIEETEKLLLDIDQNTQLSHQLHKELHAQEPWGDFSIENVERLKDSGLEIRLFSCPERTCDPEWNEKYAVETVSRSGGNVYFALFAKEGEEAEINADEFKFPQRSVSDIKKEIDKVHDVIVSDNKKLNKYANEELDALIEYKKDSENRKEFELIRNQAHSEAEGKVKVLEGWIPESKEAEMKKHLEEKGILYTEREPEEDDFAKIPIMIKNNRYASLFEPIGKLFSLPAYTEIDLTMFFAPFFMLFFGFCLGDAGYGIVILIATTAGKFKLPKAAKPFLSLGQFLGASTMIMGTVGGTFFGINLIEVDWKFSNMFLNSNQMFWLALGLGVIQILFGMCIKAANAVKNGGWMYSISTFGWMLMVISLVSMSLKAVLGYLKIQQTVIDSITWLDTVASIGGKTALVGVGMILLFNDPKANIFVRLGKGLWELYDITGLFGDVLSYIRLFALGVSGAILGLVINEIGKVFLEIPFGIGYVIFPVFLVIGHTSNILLSGLGSLVHPMRLTFVEFYKNSGWTGGGKEYKPFIKKN